MNIYQVVSVLLRKKGTIISTAQALNILKSTLFHHIQCGKIQQHSNAVKPHVTLANMVEREDFCKAFIKDDKSSYDDTLDVIHVDEKWFYMTKNTKKY